MGRQREGQGQEGVAKLLSSEGAVKYSSSQQSYTVTLSWGAPLCNGLCNRALTKP